MPGRMKRNRNGNDCPLGFQINLEWQIFVKVVFKFLPLLLIIAYYDYNESKENAGISRQVTKRESVCMK